MKPLKELLRDYLDHLEIEKNRAVKTRENYERYLNVFLAVSGVRTPRDITRDTVKRFRLHLARSAGWRTAGGAGLKKITQSYYVIALRNFLKYLAKNDIETLSADTVELPRIERRQIELVEYKDMERLLAAPAGSSLRDLRDRAILETLFSTGLRVSELCALNRDIAIDRGEIPVRGKGGKLRVVFISPRARETIAAYAAKRQDFEDALFVNTDRHSAHATGRILPRTVQRLVAHYSKKAGLPHPISPHALRHAFATDLLINGADLRSVQELLGHSNVATTQIYTHLTNKNLRDVHRAFHGRRRDK
ncbi:MAG: tyrosine-type recombinase/integrase [Candidatus Liptonbacteria bacterium]|nr:tyrosine-type recombinase/integrase [Candidatus Liptonbacteria bacterium]